MVVLISKIFQYDFPFMVRLTLYHERKIMKLRSFCPFAQSLACPEAQNEGSKNERAIGRAGRLVMDAREMVVHESQASSPYRCP